MIDDHLTAAGHSTHLMKIGPSGVEFLGIPYASPALTTIRNEVGDSTALTRVNRQDLSAISVKDELRDNWISVPAVFSGLHGVTLAEWAAAIENIERLHGGVDQRNVRDAIGVLSAGAQAVGHRQGVRNPLLSASDVRRLDENNDTGRHRSSDAPYFQGD